MYSFEGDFRRKPLQSLRGASKKEQKESLLKRAHQQRQGREARRKQQDSSVQIQAWYRGCVVRQKQATVLRHQFDKHMQSSQNSKGLTCDDLSTLTSWLNYFYRDALDGQRLIWLCQKLLKSYDTYVEHVYKQRTTSLIQIKKILLICLRYIRSISQNQSPIAIPMRMLQIFTSAQTYKVIDSKETNVVFSVWAYLVDGGYFETMRILLNEKVPASLEQSPDPPTPVAASIYDLIMTPISFAVSANNKSFCQFVLVAVSRALLCPAYTEQVGQFLLPAMAYGKYPFPFIDLIQTLISKTSDSMENDDPSSQQGFTIELTPWLLGSVMLIADKHLDTLSPAEVKKFLQVLQQLLPLLPSGDYDNQDDSDDESMDIDPQVENRGQLDDLRRKCIRMLDSPRLVNKLITCIAHEPEANLITAVAVICHCLMSLHKISVHKIRLLYTLAFHPNFIRQTWYCCMSLSTTTVTGSKTSLISMLARGLSLNETDSNQIVSLMSVFSSMFSHSLYTLHDAEFYGDSNNQGSSMPFSLSELAPMAHALRDTCLGIIELAHPDAKPTVNEDYREALKRTGVKYRSDRLQEELKKSRQWAYLFKVIAALVRQLYSRDTRRPFCPKNLWLSDRVQLQLDRPSQIYRAQGSVFTQRPFRTMQSLTKAQLDTDGPPLSNREVKNLVILTELPFIVDFEQRVKIFQKLIQKDREENQGELVHFMAGPSINVMIRRNYIYEDAFDKLKPENEPNLKQKMHVQLVNAAGLDEVGIDGGGIFREFLSELLKTGFDPNRGFFSYTVDRLLYPNPQSSVLDDTFSKHYYFLGRMLGKALYENMLVELPFASFFLSKILSRHGGDLDIHHLASLDPEMYKNLLFLKNYTGDISDLELDFTIVNNDFGHTKVEELKPGGGNIAVNNYNRIEYIHLMADYKLNKQIRAQCIAFRHGMADVINLEWLRMFDPHEIQVLISGASVPVDVGDLKQHTNYSGLYTADHPVISIFWKVVEKFTDVQKRQLLKFVTSCSRPPLLGFKDLYPAFCIHHGGTEADRLPTASTCMNLLKLPEFRDEKTMQTKLLYSIESGAGFELS
ncbi:hypothetical protein ScPMuIL_006645 [Solemya velum]